MNREELKVYYIENAEKYSRTSLWRIVLWRLGLIKPAWDEDFLQSIENKLGIAACFRGEYRLEVTLSNIRYKQKHNTSVNAPFSRFPALELALQRHTTA